MELGIAQYDYVQEWIDTNCHKASTSIDFLNESKNDLNSAFPAVPGKYENVNSIFFLHAKLI